MEIISGVYKITNTVTNDFYIGSSKDVKRRLAAHKCPSVWNRCQNNPMYLDMQKYGTDKFEFQILAEIESGQLKEKEQQFIETLQPTYNNRNANGWDIERQKEYKKEYDKKHKEEIKEYNKEYKETHKDEIKEYKKEYNNQFCFYNGQKLTLCALSSRFRRAGLSNPTQEAKKYLLKQ